MKEWFRWGAAYTLGDGTVARFWSDTWVGAAPLDVMFHRLYACSNQQEASVAEVPREGSGWLC